MKNESIAKGDLRFERLPGPIEGWMNLPLWPPNFDFGRENFLYALRRFDNLSSTTFTKLLDSGQRFARVKESASRKRLLMDDLLDDTSRVVINSEISGDDRPIVVFRNRKNSLEISLKSETVLLATIYTHAIRINALKSNEDGNLRRYAFETYNGVLPENPNVITVFELLPTTTARSARAQLAAENEVFCSYNYYNLFLSLIPELFATLRPLPFYEADLWRWRIESETGDPLAAIRPRIRRNLFPPLRSKVVFDLHSRLLKTIFSHRTHIRIFLRPIRFLRSFPRVAKRPSAVRSSLRKDMLLQVETLDTT